MSDIQLFNKISSLPEHLKKEVEDFIDFLKAKTGSKKPPERKKRELGLLKGKLKIMPNFDDPLEDFKEYM